jgi:hypothetical protein
MTTAVLLVLLELAFIARAIYRPHRDPASRIAWVVVIGALPVVGIVAYLLLNETPSLGREGLVHRPTASEQCHRDARPGALRRVQHRARARRVSVHLREVFRLQVLPILLGHGCNAEKSVHGRDLAGGGIDLDLVPKRGFQDRAIVQPDPQHAIEDRDVVADVDVSHDVLVFGKTLVEGAHEPDPLVDAVQNVVREEEAKVVRDEALHALEILRVDALEDLLKELGQGGGLFQDVLGGHCALLGGF